MFVNQSSKYAWGNGTVYLTGTEANGVDFYHSSTHLGRWRTAGLGVNTNITASGNIEVAGNISGSSTSTGSFQTIRFGPPGRNFQFYESGNDAYFGGSGLAIG